MSSGETPEQPDRMDLLHKALRVGEMPGLDAYTGELISDPENSYITRDPTPQEVRLREEQFALKVAYAGLLMSKKHPGIVTMLFDIDQTITENEGRTIRPAFPFALNTLFDELGNRLEVGLLSTNRQDGINQNIPIYFKGVEARVNPDYIISSRAKEEADPSLQEAVDGDNYAVVKDIVKSEVIQETEEGILSDVWFGSKLIILQRLAQRHPERSFVFIDDLIWADAIKDYHWQVKGMWVGPEMQNDWPLKGWAQLRAKE